MVKGRYPREYFTNPNIHEEKSIEEIYADIDAYTGEILEEQTTRHSGIEFMIPLPPLKYKGITTKGMFLSQGVSYLLKLYPDMPKIFFSMSHSMWSSYPWSEEADALLTCYKNPHREEWWRKNNPHRAGQILLPLQDADFTSEYAKVPTFNTKKDIDVLYVSRVHDVKNVPFVAKALKVYREKYNHHIKMTLIVGKDFDINYNGLAEGEIYELRQVEEVLVHVRDYIEIVPKVAHKDIDTYYTRAKLCLLASLIEGKNRTIQEAMSCDTPIIVFKDHNKYARGEHPVFFDNAGLYVPEFTPESLADTIHYGLNNLDKFEARKSYLKHYGRRNFTNRCVDSFPYYAENLPDYEPGKIHENLWVDLAIQDNYQLSFHDFLYGKNCAIHRVKGPEDIARMLKFYYGRFGIPWNEPAT